MFTNNREHISHVTCDLQHEKALFFADATSVLTYAMHCWMRKTGAKLKPP